MEGLSQPSQDHLSNIKTCNPAPIFNNIPTINLSNITDSKTRIVEACQNFGFFKVINHGVPLECMERMEDEAVKFFNLPQLEKDKAVGLGYGDRKIGPNGDIGWVEYLLFSTSSPNLMSKISSSIPKENQEFFKKAVSEYVSAVKGVACQVVELMAEGLSIEPKDVLSKLLRGEKSDSLFRLNHNPPCPQPQEFSGQNLVGFGEHTDPQLISVLKSNNILGLEIWLRDSSTWVSVPPDKNSFFISVGDCLQVMTNGKFKSVRHRVSANNLNSRISMIYFGGPPLSEYITPLPSLMEEGEESLYEDFKWEDYKKYAYSSKLGDNRLGAFEKFSSK